MSKKQYDGPGNYKFTFVVVMDGDSKEDALEQARELLSRPDFEPVEVECLEESEENDPKKIVVVNLGDIRDTSWDGTAALGLQLMAEMRKAGFEPETISPYLIEGSGDVPLLIVSGDVPLLIVLELEGNEIKKNIEVLSSIVNDKASLDIVSPEEWSRMLNGDDEDDEDEEEDE